VAGQTKWIGSGFGALSAALGLLASASSARADAYDDALARARDLEKRGDYSAAAAVLTPAVIVYEQDWEVAAELGWVAFQSGNYASAEWAYRVAMERAPAAEDARLGLGFTLARQARCREANSVFYDLLRSGNGAERAQAGAGIEACTQRFTPPAQHTSAPVLAPEPPPATSIYAGVHHYAFPSNPVKSSGTGFDVTAYHALGEHLWMLGSYGFTHYATANEDLVSSFAHHDFHLQAGYVSKLLDASLQGALLLDQSGGVGSSKHLGASLKLHVFGDVIVNASVSSYDDYSVYRIAPSWRVPITDWLSVSPGFAVQRADGGTYGAGTLAIVADTRVGTFWVDGRYGSELRPAYLTDLVVIDATEKITRGAEVGARVPISKVVSVYGSYAISRLQRTDSLTPSESYAHALSLGPLLSF
jgi:hypothetical protein